MGEGKEYISQAEEQGTIHISEEVIASIAAVAAVEVEGVGSLSANLGTDIADLLGKKNLSKGVRLEIVENEVTIAVSILVKYGYAIHEVARAVQDAVMASVGDTTGLKVIAVNVNVCGISFERPAK
jgi:uncharacterized alkaline shock family protein YloU